MFGIPVLPWKQPGVPLGEAQYLWLSGSLLILLLPVGVLAQEKAPAKLIVYLQRFRPQDYQRLLEVYGSKEQP